MQSYIEAPQRGANYKPGQVARQTQTPPRITKALTRVNPSASYKTLSTLA